MTDSEIRLQINGVVDIRVIFRVRIHAHRAGVGHFVIEKDTDPLTIFQRRLTVYKIERAPVQSWAQMARTFTPRVGLITLTNLGYWHAQDLPNCRQPATCIYMYI